MFQDRALREARNGQGQTVPVRDRGRIQRLSAIQAAYGAASIADGNNHHASGNLADYDDEVPNQASPRLAVWHVSLHLAHCPCVAHLH